jgi:Rad3-related DNA helicase
MSSKYHRLLDDIEHVECVAEVEKNTVTIKPLRANYHANKLLFDSGNKLLLMSATILNPKVFCDNLGIDPTSVLSLKIPSTFPVENRPIHLDFAGSMKMANRMKTLPKLISKINKIMDKHKNSRGIIHCHSFWLMEEIMKGLSKNNNKRLTCSRDFWNKEDVMRAHESRPDSVIIAPAMTMGVDLKDDLSRFQVICKIPYPDFTKSKQMQIRMKEDRRWYLWLVACTLVQSYGRSVRSETDYAETYILDADFDTFFNQAEGFDLIPSWFTEALRV